MPILAAESSLYPSNLLDELAFTDPERRWYVVYTRSRQEKSLARQLHAMRVPFYLPLVPKASMIAGRRVNSLLPLFGSYLFMFADDMERIEAMATKRVAHQFAPNDVHGVTRDLRHVRALIDSGAPLTIESRMEAGQQGSINNGALVGVEGVVVSRLSSDRLRV